MDILVAAGSSMDPAPAGQVTLFINTEDSNILSYIDENGNIFRYSANDSEALASCCSCDIAKTWIDRITCALNSGLLTANEFGNLVSTGFTVTATEDTTVPGKKTCTVTISSQVTPVESISVEPANATLDTIVTTTVQLTATILPISAPQGVTWVSTNPAVATVNASGLVTAVATGTCTIYGFCTQNPSLYDTCGITVQAL